MNDFLPINKKEMLERGWQDVDFVFVTGDAKWLSTRNRMKTY